MPTFYLRGRKHTIACALREILEERHPDEFVACSILHPDDDHIVVQAPSESDLRTCLLLLKDKIKAARAALVK